jgi:hypothetical protein
MMTMKYLKTLGLGAVVALALMAIGTGTASAAKVCSTTGTGAACTSGKVVANGTIVSGSSTKAELTSTFDNITCTESVASGQITNGETGTGDVESVTFASCKDSFGSACTAKATASSTNKWAGTSSATGGGNGTATINNVTGSFTCPVFGVNTTCIYSAASVTTTITGGEPAKGVAEKVALTRESGSGGACSEKATFSGTYTGSGSKWLF